MEYQADNKGADPREMTPAVPNKQKGILKWKLEVRGQGLALVAKVIHEEAGESPLTSGKAWDKAQLESELQQLGVVYGIRQEAWENLLQVEDGAEVTIAEATLSIPPIQAQWLNFVNSQPVSEAETENVDFFASKIELVSEGTVLASKIPGKEGVPGKNIFGRGLPAASYKDFKFHLKKNVHLSEDGLQVIASCSGHPLREDTLTYSVENVYVLHHDVDLKTGSIDFPGDVLIDGNVQDGLHIFAGGKVEISGSTSHAEIRAEKGLKIQRNVLSGKLVVGQNYVQKAKIRRTIKELYEDLNRCLSQVSILESSASVKNFNQGQLLKITLEKNFPDLPKQAASAWDFILAHKGEVTEELTLGTRTAKHFLTGLGPLTPQSVEFLEKVSRVFKYYLESMTLEIPDKLYCEVEYAQGASIETGGDFLCAKGVYNCLIRADGNVRIESVCRGGRIIAGGDVTINELGGSGVSNTFVQILGDKRLKVNYCHPNIVVAVNKQIIRIEEAYRELEIYREKGRVQIDKLRADPL